MRFIAAAILAIAATASASAVQRRTDYGYWDFTGSCSFPASGYKSYRVAATYHNAEIADPIEVTCSYLYSPPDKSVAASCSDPSFSYDFGHVGMATPVTNVTLKQTVGLWGSQVTVTGVKELEFDFSGGSGRSGTASGVVEAQTGTA
ncbi:hypothetical protein Cob_v010148 [Colletotrichum orbiculare MAFF 240422]|uniref:Uncharacterized protein n=1 Tax=Colletotrichum orbiculare (strain 104-T / ATCC 96160 / CBS 514.97 / LARS 414 / MAFF 240422) TaxID=1213857 RepID=N4VCZ4_COLOR|nr:hypothetical protein Cob_v010148 [Colletotrichum orbiculare MAFF 240422]